MRIELICVGTELLTGKINTHVSFFGQLLQSLSLALSEAHTVPDVLEDIRHRITESLQRSDIVFICGGLGPTFDDITREAAAQALRRKLVIDKKVLANIKQRTLRKKSTFSAYEKKQAELLEGAESLCNEPGLAPGMLVREKKKALFLIPGPSHEMQYIAERFIIPYLKKHGALKKTKRLKISLFGLPEADIDRRLRSLIRDLNKDNNRELQFSIIADQSIVTLTLYARGDDERSLTRQLDEFKKKIHGIFGRAVLGEGAVSLPEAVASLCTARKITLSVAESCTGGLCGALITSVPGSSIFFKQGLIVYSNQSKIKLLGIAKDLIEKHGAVSRATAYAMAESMRTKAQTDYSISITGIAGPHGATETAVKKAGLVYIGLAGPDTTRVREFQFSGDRVMVRKKAALNALDMLRKTLML